MIIDQLHYITQEGPNGESHLEMMVRACESGVKWVQLRIKDIEKEELYSIAMEAKNIASKYDVKLIINDHVDIALKVKADGVHLGQNDMSVKDARRILGDQIIIGGTANDLESILRHVDDGADYVGVGPFRFTTSKKDLSPVLGIEGYEKIGNELEKKRIWIPLIAIGGIGLNDISALRSVGFSGIAVASLINTAETPDTLVIDIYNEIEKWKN